MSSLGVIGNRFDLNRSSLKEFDDALNIIKRHKKLKSKKTAINEILEIIVPICKVLKGELSTTASINENNIIEILESKYVERWPEYKEKIYNLEKKLKISTEFNTDDLDILEDIADAIDVECDLLFQRMQER